MAGSPKNKYWVAVLYPENMIEDWQILLPDAVQLPGAYCLHDKDLDNDGDDRKVHVHLILAWPNTTTYNHALSVFESLSRPGCSCLNTCKPVISIRGSYNYLIHDTEGCRKQGKYLYDASERVCFNNFDIGSYEQLGLAEKNEMVRELCEVIIKEGFTNFTDFYMYVLSNYDDMNYFDMIKGYSGLFERLTKGNFQRYQMSQIMKDSICTTNTGL